jgi:hypothetical protein
MKSDHAQRLLDRIGMFRDPCDFDLLVFFTRHPSTLLASEGLAVLLGYEPEQVAASLDLLVGAGLVTRTPTQAGAAQMFVFVAGAPSHGWLPDLLHVALTREGRLAMLGALRRAEPGPLATPERASGNAARRSGPGSGGKMEDGDDGT